MHGSPTRWLYRAKRFSPRTIPKNSSGLDTADAKSIHVRGEPNAPVTLEALTGALRQLVERAHARDVRVMAGTVPP